MSAPVTEREQALARWIDELSTSLCQGNERWRVILLAHALMVLAADDDNDQVIPTPEEMQKFVGAISRGCKARGGRRAEAAVAAAFAALAAVISATRGA